MPNVALSWSSGKDACLTLLSLQAQADVNVSLLFTSHVNGVVPYQNAPVEVVQAQARAIGIPLLLIELPQVFPPNEIYQKTIVDALKQSPHDIDAVAFGDMFANGIAQYRQSYIEPAGWQAWFPIMGKADEPERDISCKHAGEILAKPINSVISCVDNRFLHSSWCGRDYDKIFLDALPHKVDPCGEHGEFHTIVTDAPCFRWPIELQLDGCYQSEHFSHLKIRLK